MRRPSSEQPMRLASGEGDGVDVAAVVRLAAMGGAAKAEKSRRLRIGARPEILDAGDVGAGEPGRHIAGEIEQRVLGARRRPEETLVARLGGKETLDEIGPY